MFSSFDAGAAAGRVLTEIQLFRLPPPFFFLSWFDMSANLEVEAAETEALFKHPFLPCFLVAAAVGCKRRRV